MKKWFLFLLLVGCKVSSFLTDVDPKTSFESIHTFKIVEFPYQVNIPQPEYDNRENRALIDQSIKDEMRAWGLTEQLDSSDVIITYTLLIRDRVDSRVDSAVIYKPWVDTKQDSFNYTEGAFTLIIMDGLATTILAQSKLEGVMDRDAKKFKSSIPRIVKLMVKRIQEDAKN